MGSLPTVSSVLSTDTVTDHPKTEIAKVESSETKYRRGSAILEDRLSHIPLGSVPGPLVRQLIYAELDSTGRTMPALWEDAIRHPVGVAALREDIASSVLWLARCLLSETNRPSEYEDIAWVVRNRVEANFGGESFYRTVILDRLQFSHFNTASGRTEMERYTYARKGRRWQAAIEVAYKVITAPASARTVPANTFYYYSTVSMKRSYSTYCHKSHTAREIARLGHAHPKWAHQYRKVKDGADADRFRFFAP